MACMVLFMAQTTTEELTKNVLYALRVSKVTQADLAVTLGIGINTLRRRLDDGKFTFGQLAVIAKATKTPLVDLLPDAA